MTKLTFIVILGILLTQITFAKNPGQAEFECYYKLSFLKDTTSDTYTSDMMVLRASSQKSLFFNRRSYMIDSMMDASPSESMLVDMLASGASKYRKGITSYMILKDFNGQVIDYSDEIHTTHYRYQEGIPTFHWTITDSTKSIWDYPCQKALCSFRGRTYEAWFTMDIPISDGPWKFCGLPGLILEVYDTQRHYLFEFAGLYRSSQEIAMPSFDYTNTTREKYLKAKISHIKDPLAAFFAEGGKITKSDGTELNLKKKEMKYGLMERY